jgi:phosphoribosylformylglycinamidine synthase
MARHKEAAITPEVAKEHGLSADEFARVKQILGRDPTWTELGIFSVMWSEHCSYKSSRVHLRNLPTSGPRVIQGPGENAGVVDIGDGQAVVFKMESHNHPSFIEPYQGAATGVGGILRDVFTMGARPIACLDSLRFGRPDHPKTRHLVEGVVAGIAGYGNAFGVPTVGGEVFFDESYDGNILVNAMAVGLARTDKIFKGTASGVGNPVLYFGSKTGRDGIHGATMASAEFDDASESKRPTVQVGDPFTEKLLLEACLELMASDCLVGIQDMGAAGLTSSSVEMAARAGNGIELDLDAVPRRETGMTPYELMLSESQERMLAVVKRGREKEALAIFDKWDLDAAVVGKVTDTGKIRVLSEGQAVAEIPVAPLAEGLKYERPYARPASVDQQKLDLAQVKNPGDLGAVLLKLLASPNIASKEWVYRQYDHMVRVGTVVRPGADAAVIRILDGAKDPAHAKGVALTTDCNSRFCALDPYEGARLAIAEAYRNLSTVGAEPLAATDCLNFGNPERPEVMWTLVEAIRGLGDACRALETPIVSGNVSLYNDTDGKSIKPTPTIGMVGLMPDASQAVGASLPDREGTLAIGLLGVNTDEIGGSEYLKVVHGKTAGAPPKLDVARERAVGQACVALVRAGLVQAAHDCAEGGLAVALAEMCISGGRSVGATVKLEEGLRPDLLLFGEAPSRILVAFDPEREAEVRKMAGQTGAPFTVLGASGGRNLTIFIGNGRVLDAPLQDLAAAWQGGFRSIVSNSLA